MLMANDRANIGVEFEYGSDLEDDGDAGDLTIDLEEFWEILDEKNPLENHQDLPVELQQVGLQELESTGAAFAQPSYNSEFPDTRIDTSDFSGSPASCPGSLSDWTYPASCLASGSNSSVHDFPSYGIDYHNETQYQIPNYVPPFGFSPEGQSLDTVVEKSDLNKIDSFNLSEYTARMPDKSETADSCSMDIVLSIPWDPRGGYNPQSVSRNVGVSNLTEDSIISRDNAKCEDNKFKLSTKQDLAKLVNGSKVASHFLPHSCADMYGNEHEVAIKNENVSNLVSKGMACSLFDGAHKKFSVTNGFRAVKNLRKLFPPVLFSESRKIFSVSAKPEKEEFSLVSKIASQSFDSISETAKKEPNQAFEQSFPQPFTPLKSLYCEKEIMGEMTQFQSKNSHFPNVGFQTARTTTIVNSFDVDDDDDDDDDLCIIEDPNEHARSNICSASRKPLADSQRLTINDPLNHVGLGGIKLKANDERLVLRVALQDLSQPKTEASPPDGVMAMPLLRHQRIALSWMVQKETTSIHCSGGILADDQGLGKTISTIALILKERSPNSSTSAENFKQSQRETYNLDEDGCSSSVLGGHVQESLNGSLISRNPVLNANGRPRAGTLVVCPTSVLRQWADELHNKVTRQANLSFLIYHGSNRTKDPYELAKYDVVLTTYAIVSMEVPKQPLDDKDDDETERTERDNPSDFPFSRKRKYPFTSKKSIAKAKKESERLLLEASARPLARVGWFRVVLDEAQSIKNHRTQTARACWGLRAKRRWCLSGTPIQNAVDDLYSYFRFLRYDPYATYKSFCSSIKIPVTKNPTTGYKKLQAILKTVMLRRTKGTLLDGEPIINLPPKHIELKKVEFTEEERDFYSRLEDDSRAQFEEYAAAGTVKQNYVNILLMLLRLRQACDHPLLVKGNNSSSAWKSSVEVAKKLPREKQVGLLSCLEASLAICGVCNDPPEDAVVTSCGHVFCNQCICEHLSADDNQCPTTNCKNRLNTSSVFSRAALKCCLSQEHSQDGTPDSSVSENTSWGPPFESSKIKTALKVLESISKPKPLPKKSPDPLTFLNKSIDPFEEVSNTDINEDEDSDFVESSKQLVKVAGEKAIVFSQWTRMLDLLENGLKSSSIQYRRLDGTMSVLARDRAVNDFKTLPEVTVILMSLKAASLGLNMVAACHVILLDLWWNPTTEDQAVDRAHRIGQTRPVSVLRLTVKDTVEDRILALQEKKREMVASAFGEDRTGSNQTRLTVDDLKYLFMA